MDINHLVMGDKRVRGARLYTRDDARTALVLIAHDRVDLSTLIAKTINIDSFLAVAENGTASEAIGHSHATVVRWAADAEISA